MWETKVTIVRKKSLFGGTWFMEIVLSGTNRDELEERRDRVKRHYQDSPWQFIVHVSPIVKLQSQSKSQKASSQDARWVRQPLCMAH